MGAIREPWRSMEVSVMGLKQESWESSRMQIILTANKASTHRAEGLCMCVGALHNT